MNDDFGLEQFDEEYASAEVEERDFEPIPDGKFQVQVDRIEMTHAKNSGNPMLKWALKILGPTHQGRLLWRNNMLVSAENIRWLKGDLHICGLELEKLSELPANLEKLLDVKLEVTKRTRGDNENIYLNRRIVMDDVPEDDMDGDVPF